MKTESFTFGIPLIARAAAADWPLIESLLALTLRSIAAQDDNDYRVIVAGHDRPDIDAALPFDFIEADWPAEAVRADNLDRGRKVGAISEAVLAAGGGLLMFVDADDWIDTRLVRTTRATMARGQIGAVVDRGWAISLRGGRALPIPHKAFDRSFDKLCGSSVIARLDPDGCDALHCNPHAVLHEHYRFADLARERGLLCGGLDVVGAYVVNTAANHSEMHGPFAAWRRSFNDAIAIDGLPIDDLLLSQFGLDQATVASCLEFHC